MIGDFGARRRPTVTAMQQVTRVARRVGAPRRPPAQPWRAQPVGPARRPAPRPSPRRLPSPFLLPPPPAALAPLAPPPAFDEDAPLPLTAEQPVLFVPEGEAAIPAEIVSDEDAPMPMMDGFGQAQPPEVGAGRLIVGVAGAALVLDGLISILASTDRRGLAQVVRLGRAGLGAGMLVKALRR